MTNPFDYLTVLVSIVLGLAIANVLSGLAGLMHARERVAFYWPPVVWAIWLFFLAIQHWWAEWGVRNTTHWTFAAFLMAMLVPVNFFLLSSLVLPPPNSAEPVDLREWYVRNHRWFFGLLACLPLLSILEEVVRAGHMASLVNLGFLLAFAAIAAVTAFVTSRRASEWITVQAMVLTGAYVALLYFRLSN